MKLGSIIKTWKALIGVSLLGLVLAVLLVWGLSAHQAVTTIHELLAENDELKSAISSLTREDQIGYAKVIEQSRNDEGELVTTLRFVETARDDKREPVLKKKYTIRGDTIHFDALIVRFDNRLVMDDKEKALYLWRRVYGEYQSPAEGFPIEDADEEPARYADLFAELPVDHRKMFWEAVWDLANDPERLNAHGISAVYGSAVYTRLKPGLIYIFKINATGQVSPEVVPDI